MNTELVNQVNKTMLEFEELIAGFSLEEFNRVPFEGSWTAGQVGQHMTQLRSYQNREILDGLEGMRNNLNESISSNDLTKTCTAFAVPEYGCLTRLEAANFVLYHTQRHIIN